MNITQNEIDSYWIAVDLARMRGDKTVSLPVDLARGLLVTATKSLELEKTLSELLDVSEDE